MSPGPGYDDGDGAAAAVGTVYDVRKRHTNVSELGDSEIGSVFDVMLSEVNQELPIKVPVRRYVQEALMGMHGSSAVPPPPTQKSSIGSLSCDVRKHWLRLRRLVCDDPALGACEALFWLTLGVIFSRATDQAKAELRTELAGCWHQVSLGVNKYTSMRTKDWLFTALPMVFVQAIYRLYVDAFREDRSDFVTHAAPLLEKLTTAVHNEIVGFRMSAETGRQMRQRFFFPEVVERPHVNQVENLKSQKRQETMEMHRNQAPLLTFGQQGGVGLEELQLEHLWSQRQEARKQKLVKNASAHDSDEISARPLRGVPTELSADRYVDLEKFSAELLQKHLGEVDQATGSASPAEVSQRVKPAVAASESEAAESPRGTCSESLSPSASRSLGCRSFLLRNRRQLADVERRRRKELLARHIMQDSLRESCHQHSLDTAWVSPVVDRLAPSAGSRQTLQKSYAEARLVRMVPALPHMLPSQSEPSLSNKPSQTVVTATAAEGSARRGAAQRWETVRQNVAQRAEGSRKRIYKMPFTSYMKEYDVATGAKKQLTDWDLLQKQEQTYVEELETLIRSSGHVGPAMPGSKLATRQQGSCYRRAASSGPSFARNSALHPSIPVCEEHAVGDSWNSLTALPRR